MRSGHSTWRPLFRTIERSWPLKTLPHRFSPPPLDIQWVGQVRNEPHCNSVLFHILSTPPLSVSPSHSCFITFGYFPPMPPSLFLHHLFPPPAFQSLLFLQNTPVQTFCLFHPPLSLSTPSPRSLMNIKRWAQALHAVRLTSNTFSTSSCTTHATLYISSFFSNRILPCNYFPMNISSLLNGSCRVCVFVCVFMSSFTNT